MDVTMIGLQNAGKTSLLRVISVSGRTCIVDKVNADASGWRVHDRVSNQQDRQARSLVLIARLCEAPSQR